MIIVNLFVMWNQSRTLISFLQCRFNVWLIDQQLLAPSVRQVSSATSAWTPSLRHAFRINRCMVRCWSCSAEATLVFCVISLWCLSMRRIFSRRYTLATIASNECKWVSLDLIWPPSITATICFADSSELISSRLFNFSFSMQFAILATFRLILSSLLIHRWCLLSALSCRLAWR